MLFLHVTTMKKTHVAIYILDVTCIFKHVTTRLKYLLCMFIYIPVVTWLFMHVMTVSKLYYRWDLWTCSNMQKKACYDRNIQMLKWRLVLVDILKSYYSIQIKSQREI